MSIKINDQFHTSTHEVVATAIRKVLIEPNKTDTKCDPKSGINIDPDYSWYPAYGSTIEIENISMEELNRWRAFIKAIKPFLRRALKEEFEKGKVAGTDLLGRLNKGEITLNDIPY